MSSTEQAPEPTMDEILASIRRIIADDDGGSVKGSKPQAAAEPARREPPAAHAPTAAPESASASPVADEVARALRSGEASTDGDDDILELTNDMFAQDDTATARPEPAPAEGHVAPASGTATGAENRPVATAPAAPRPRPAGTPAPTEAGTKPAGQAAGRAPKPDGLLQGLAARTAAAAPGHDPKPDIASKDEARDFAGSDNLNFEGVARQDHAPHAAHEIHELHEHFQVHERHEAHAARPAEEAVKGAASEQPGTAPGYGAAPEPLQAFASHGPAARTQEAARAHEAPSPVTGGELRAPAAAARDSADTSALEDCVRELLRPMLREWVDENLPRILENAVRHELAAQLRDKQQRRH